MAEFKALSSFTGAAVQWWGATGVSGSIIDCVTFIDNGYLALANP